MTIVVSVIIGIVLLSILIVFHEFGHFIVAKRNGIAVPEFSLGMGPKLFSFKKGETLFTVRLLLIGGACQMLGEDEVLEDERSFNSKGPWARFATIFAGPFFNFILAFVFAVLMVALIGYDPIRIQGVYKDSAATAIVINNDAENGELAGKTVSLMRGDIITSYDGRHYSLCRDFLTNFIVTDGMDATPVEISFERDGKEYTGIITPKLDERYLCGFTYSPSEEPMKVDSVSNDGAFLAAGIKADDVILKINGNEIASGMDFQNYIEEHPFGKDPVIMTIDHKGTVRDVTVQPLYQVKFTSPQYADNSLGIALNFNDRNDANALEVIKYAFLEVKYSIKSTFKSLGWLITGKLSKNDVGGPVRIVAEIDNVVEETKDEGIFWTFINIVSWLILLSANLGIMNLLPIPALDGGRLIFIIIELVRGKPIPREKEGIIHGIGLVLLLALMIFIFFNDIVNVFF